VGGAGKAGGRASEENLFTGKGVSRGGRYGGLPKSLGGSLFYREGTLGSGGGAPGGGGGGNGPPCWSSASGVW